MTVAGPRSKHAGCIGSGSCCKTAPCPFGEWDVANGRCAFLLEAARGAGWTGWRCGKHDEIAALPPERGAALAPAFGAGCCSPLFNRERAAIFAAAADGDPAAEAMVARSAAARSRA